MRGRFFAAVALSVWAAGCGTDAEQAGRPETSSQPATRSTPTVTSGRRRAAEPHPPRERNPLQAMRQLSAEHARPDDRLSKLASKLVGYEASVRCWRTRGWKRLMAVANADLPPDERADFAGITDLYDVRIDLSPWVCDTLASVPARVDSVHEVDLADAMQVFVHETRHLTAAGSNEAVAECDALQKLDEAAQLLGLSPGRARRLARIAWTDVYPNLPAAYRSPECHPGGSLDHEPETARFP